MENTTIKDQEQQTSTSLIEEKHSEPQIQQLQLPQTDFENIEENLNDVQDLKKVLLNLQCLLMSDMNVEALDENSKTLIKEAESMKTSNKKVNYNQGYCNDNEYDDEGFRPLTNLTPDEEIAILRSKIQQLEILCTDLRNGLNDAKSDTLYSNGNYTGLKQRLTDQDNTILELKNENLNLILLNQQLVKSKEEMSTKMEETSIQIKKLECEVAKRDDIIVKLKLENKKVKQVSETLEIVQEKKVIF